MYVLSPTLLFNVVRHIIHSKWILPQPNRAPVFIGETARRNTPCVTSPIPPLQESDEASDLQTLINWPVGNSSNPLDKYLSDCEYNTYCSLESRICIESLQEDDTCESTHQCVNTMQCIQNRCTDTSLDDDEDNEHDSNHVHTAIIVVVVVVAVLATVSVALFVYFYRRRKRLRSTKATSFAMETTPPPPASSRPREEESTPTMQQQHLQYQLHRQHAPDIKDNESTTHNIPPPPYTP
ncbi:hypothetical protein BJV82DRAFT_673590 [Fennellomyces sp. T-0311]|nr:hypothetical protein BJV82DRAFT_673590 [Fennellomyces sp. T-0311]